MSIRRLLGTTAAMAAAAAGLHTVTPDLSGITGTGLDLQRAVDTVGAESVLLAGVAALAWAAWLWGVLGLGLTALSALPGAVGALARVAARCVLPASARRAAALALGVGLVTAGPSLAGCASAPGTLPQAVVTASGQGPVPDWPAAGPEADPPTAPASDRPAPPVPDRPTFATPAPVPDWPAPAPGHHVVLRGDCLWDIAAGDLARRTGTPPTDGEVASAVSAWWQTNADVIGPDPDLLLPGQVLRPPPAS
ncbi:hypothetical protein E4P41_20025 [Geodermatophilus sp. DF01-2]|uniref:LysM peptidoglycan-binding domain-containing protein n=1 Tax=Geodermatophilus sp. DF01-2 TaxID=2559610 RepID=UPI0010747B9D|nr:hypothetical protein [Geodermatophilus sp. DF01_2]TFV54039.1 hypothetical protein E4P41_20025 [Geodermatophilus sp. DF01_2]